MSRCRLTRLDAESAAVLLDPKMYALFLAEVDGFEDSDDSDGAEDSDDDIQAIPKLLHGGIDYLTDICQSELGSLCAPATADSEDGAGEVSNPFRRSSKSTKRRRVVEKKPKYVRDLVMKDLRALHETGRGRWRRSEAMTVS